MKKICFLSLCLMMFMAVQTYAQITPTATPAGPPSAIEIHMTHVKEARSLVVLVEKTHDYGLLPSLKAYFNQYNITLKEVGLDRVEFCLLRRRCYKQEVMNIINKINDSMDVSERKRQLSGIESYLDMLVKDDIRPKQNRARITPPIRTPDCFCF